MKHPVLSNYFIYCLHVRVLELEEQMCPNPEGNQEEKFQILYT
jgi:hypothetical protein